MKQELDLLIRAGQFKKAQAILKKVRVSQLSRSESIEVAKLAGRVGLLQLSLKILRPIVRGEQLLLPATDAEKIQYANTLRKLGAVSEAIDILKGVDSNKNPDAYLNLAFCYSHLWQYDLVIQPLRNYLSVIDANSYLAAVAKVNLLAALINENQLREASELSVELLQNLNPSEATLLLGNVWELTAQLKMKMNDWNGSLKSLEKATSLLKHAANSADALYIEKWMAVAQSLKKGVVTDELIKVRDRSVELQQWETFRDSEFFLAKLSGDEAKLIHLYFGTPFESYRKRIVETLGGIQSIPTSYLWSTDENPVDIFDLSLAQTEDQCHGMPAGQALHRMWIVLSQDFYKPYRVVSLFSKLFPGDYFDPATSPNRAHQIMKRLRQWWENHDLPFEIKENDGNYQLLPSVRAALRIPQQTLSLDGVDLELNRFKLLVKDNEFSSKEAAKVLSMSRSETHRLLQVALKNGVVELNGATNNAVYRKRVA